MFRAGSGGPHRGPFSYLYVNSQPMMSPEACFFFLMTLWFVLNINFPVRGSIQHTWWSVCLGRSWLVPNGLATAWSTTWCPKTAASWSSVILACVQERMGADRGRRYLWIHPRSYLRTHLRRHRRRGADGDTCWGHSWSFTFGKEFSGWARVALRGLCPWVAHARAGTVLRGPVVHKLWMSRGAVRRTWVRKERQRRAITSRLQPSAPFILSAKGLGGTECRHTENEGAGMSKVEEAAEGRRRFGLKLSLGKGEENNFHC